MNFNVIIILLLLLTNSGISAPVRAESPAVGVSSASLQWLAFGDIRGHLEPCGCDPRSDLGSVQRLDAYLRRERMSHPDIVIFHLGNDSTSEVSETSTRKNTSIAKSLAVIAPTVSLLNRGELSQMEASLPRLNYVISNFKGKNPDGTKPFIQGSGFTAFGFVEPFLGSKSLVPFSLTWLKDLQKPSGQNQAGDKVLLYSGSKKTLKKIYDAHVFDVIIASNPLDDSKEFGDEERRNESTLIAVKGSKQDVLMVPVGGQGVIRSPSLQHVPPAQTVSSLLEKQKPPAGGLTFGSQTGLPSAAGGISPLALDVSNKPVIVKWLDPAEESGVSTDILSIISEYRNASSSAMDTLVKARMADLASSPFIGAEACQSCHATSYKKWQESKHAIALPTLVSQHRETDPECVSCHVLGFTSKGGFVSEAASPKFANVQCESCHGPRRNHVEAPSVKAKTNVKAKDACAECHTKPHSPAFNFSEYWKKIEHK